MFQSDNHLNIGKFSSTSCLITRVYVSEAIPQPLPGSCAHQVTCVTLQPLKPVLQGGHGAMQKLCCNALGQYLDCALLDNFRSHCEISARIPLVLEMFCV